MRSEEPGGMAEPQDPAGAPALAPEDLDSLYDFALTVTWDPDTAFEAVVAATEERYEPEDLPELFERVRKAALRLAPPPPDEIVDLDAELPPPDHPAGGSLEALALGVAGGLRPSERAALDLGLRHRFEGVDLATVLDTDEDEAGEAVERARQHADRLLGHYVLARVATDACPALREALAEPPEQLEPLADLVDAHLAQCSMCTDRRHSVHPPSALLADLPARHAPESLHQIVSPPEDDDEPWFRRVRDPRILRWVALVTGLVAAAVFLGFQLFGDAGGDSRPRARVAVRIEPEALDLATDASSATATLRNRTGRDVEFTVETDVSFVAVEPASGTLPPGGSTELTLTLDRSAAPEGHSITTVRVVSAGGTSELDVAVDVVRAPDITDLLADPAQVSPAPCENGITGTTVSAAVADDSGVESVVARWSGVAAFAGEDEGPGESAGEAELSAADGRYQARLGPFGEPGTVTWTVEATDAGGNTSTSDEATFEVVSECVPADEENA